MLTFSTLSISARAATKLHVAKSYFYGNAVFLSD